mgnify:CR=1 FL=1
MSKRKEGQLQLHPGDLQLSLSMGSVCVAPVREEVPFFFIAIHDGAGWHEQFVHVSRVLSLLSRYHVDRNWIQFLRETVYGIKGYQHRHEAQLFLQLLRTVGHQ